MKTYNLILIFLLFFSCQNSKNTDKRNKSKLTEIDSLVTENSVTDTINYSNQNKFLNYIGKYPKSTDFFENPEIIEKLKNILENDYSEYMDFVSVSGNGAFQEENGLIYGDISITGVGGGYSSLVIIDKKTGEFYLYWLQDGLFDNKYKFYGKKPIPKKVLELIVKHLNVTWGHSALIVLDENTIQITPKNKYEELSKLYPIIILDSTSSNIYEKYGFDKGSNCYSCDIAKIEVRDKTLELINVCGTVQMSIEILEKTIKSGSKDIRTRQGTFIFYEMENSEILELKFDGFSNEIKDLRLPKFYTQEKNLIKFKVHDCGDFQG